MKQRILGIALIVVSLIGYCVLLANAETAADLDRQTAALKQQNDRESVALCATYKQAISECVDIKAQCEKMLKGRNRESIGMCIGSGMSECHTYRAVYSVMTSDGQCDAADMPKGEGK